MSSPQPKNDRPPTYVLLDVSAAAADIFHLLALDRAWTGAQERSAEFSDRDRETLYALGNSLDAQLAIVERHAAMLCAFFESNDTWVNQRVRGELASDHIADSHREGIIRILGGHEEYATRGAEAARAITRIVPQERTELRTKVLSLRGPGPAITDLSHEAFCGIAASGLVADLAVCPETLGIGCAAAIAIYGIMHYEGC